MDLLSVYLSQGFAKEREQEVVRYLQRLQALRPDTVPTRRPALSRRLRRLRDAVASRAVADATCDAA